MAIYNQTYNINNQCGMGNMNFGQGLLYGMLGSLTGMVGGGSYMGMNGSLFNMPGLGNMYGSPASFFGMGGYGCCGGMSGYSDSYYASMAGMSVANVVLGGVFSAIGSYRAEKAEAKAQIVSPEKIVSDLQESIDAFNEKNTDEALEKSVGAPYTTKIDAAQKESDALDLEIANLESKLNANGISEESKNNLNKQLTQKRARREELNNPEKEGSIPKLQQQKKAAIEREKAKNNRELERLNIELVKAKQQLKEYEEAQAADSYKGTLNNRKYNDLFEKAQIVSPEKIVLKLRII